MANFQNNSITEYGRLLLAEVQAGAVFIPTRIVLGSGNLPAGKEPTTMTDVVSPVKDLNINKKEKTPDGKVVFGGAYDNQGVTKPFYLRELALYARAEYRNEDGSVKKAVDEVLYSYGNAGATADYMPAYSTETVVEKQLDIVVYIGNSAKVELSIESGVYMTVGMAREMAAGLGGVRKADISIPTNDWNGCEGEYPYTVSVEREEIKATHIPIVSLHRDSLAVAEAAGMCSSAETVDGAVRFWARNIPTADLEATLALLTPGTGELGAAGGGSAYVLPVATTETAGVVRIGEGLSVTADGTISVSGGGIGEDDVATPEEMESMLDRVFPDPDAEGGISDG